jgi:hypothetical protein
MSLQGRSYRIRTELPVHLRSLFNNQRYLIVSLRTDSRSQAERLKPKIMRDISSMINEAERKYANAEKYSPIDRLMALATGLREQARTAHAEVFLPGEKEEPPSGVFAEFYAVARGSTTSLESHLSEWLVERAYPARQDADAQRAVKMLVRFLISRGYPTTVSNINRLHVGEWVSSRRKDVSSKTVNKDLSFISGLFRHCIRKGQIDMNPANGMSLPKQRDKYK